jgi:hypothetical protein
MDSDLQSAVYNFIQATKEITGGNKNMEMREVKETKKKAKQHIIDMMINKQLSYIELDGTYLLLKQKLNKPTLNVEFAARAYQEFHKEPSRLVGSEEERSTSFGKYMFGLQKHLSDVQHDITVSKRVPMAARLLDQFPLNNT